MGEVFLIRWFGSESDFFVIRFLDISIVLGLVCVYLPNINDFMKIKLLFGMSEFICLDL